MSTNGSQTAGHPASPRVLEVGAAAIKLAVREVLGREVSEEDAMQLGDIGDLSRTLQALEDRLSYGRAAEGARLSREARLRIAVAEVIADAKGLDTAARLKLIQDAVTREAAHIISEGGTAGKISAAEVLLAEIRDSNPRLRAYLRRLDRVRTRQLNRLSVTILDPDKCETARNKLDALFESFVRRALSQTDHSRFGNGA